MRRARREDPILLEEGWDSPFYKDALHQPRAEKWEGGGGGESESRRWSHTQQWRVIVNKQRSTGRAQRKDYMDTTTKTLIFVT